MKFNISINSVFEAKNIDDAFVVLADYFKKMADDPIDTPSIFEGEYEFLINPVEQDNKKIC